MDRRTFLAGTGAALLASPLAAGAQPPRKVYRIGIISGGTTAVMIGPQPTGPYTGAFLRGLRELGYVYGEHFVTEPRGTEGRAERLPTIVSELVRLQVDVIVSGTYTALKQVPSTIPVVIVSGDPVASGLVQNLGHPGGNLTGLTTQGMEITGKQLELLKELVPGSTLVAVLWNQPGLVWKAAEAAARERGWKLLSLEIQETGEIEGALKAATKAHAGALLVRAHHPLISHARRVAELVARSRLPAMYESRWYPQWGGLISYGPDEIDMWRRGAVFVDKILRGAKPGDLPIEQPTKFELVINLKTAKALGLTIPPSLLGRADEVIQ